MAAEPTHASPSLSGGAGLATTPAVDPVTSNVTAEVLQDVPAPGHLPLEADVSTKSWECRERCSWYANASSLAG